MVQFWIRGGVTTTGKVESSLDASPCGKKYPCVIEGRAVNPIAWAKILHGLENGKEKPSTSWRGREISWAQIIRNLSPVREGKDHWDAVIPSLPRTEAESSGEQMQLPFHWTSKHGVTSTSNLLGRDKSMERAPLWNIDTGKAYSLRWNRNVVKTPPASQPTP